MHLLLALSALAETPATTPAPKAQDPATLYASECGGCHFPYPARFLPVRSWTALMDGLPKHFGEDATLPAETRGVLLTWLDSDAADLHRSRVPAEQTPLRITELSWFRGEHREIPTRFVRDNAEVKSLSRCDACHTRAKDGRFGEGDIAIPGVGRWEEEEGEEDDD